MLWAAARGELEIIRILVENGAQVLKPRSDGITALHLAAATNDVHVLDYVLRTKTTSSVDMLSDAVCKHPLICI